MATCRRHGWVVTRGWILPKFSPRKGDLPPSYRYLYACVPIMPPVEVVGNRGSIWIFRASSTGCLDLGLSNRLPPTHANVRVRPI